eukprot:CAMPEP_0201739910 /NCGR_PEP_ID=MMETSP0593-20130828/46027_1 /ASSEMBLY_ACC=CAM_ASM_000672 /TAXON_ID=267983 /ORGANISM="Skeletonema japonicum, Strain CCMP2506" /LENGTH=823 /DNA_ID=CAMNT_0048234205 /DNA_START=62 /DNA_END=2534 /DNA_ORIENTATION=-
MVLSKDRRFTILLLGLLGSTTYGFAPISPSRATNAHVVQHPQQSLVPTFSTQFIQPISSSNIATSSSTTSLKAGLQLDEETTQKLILLTFEKAIEAGIPALFFIVTTWWFISMMRAQRDGGNGGGGMGRGRRGGGGRGDRSGGGARGRRGKRGGGRGMMGQSSSSKLGPVEELYDDIYDDLSGPEDNIPPFLKLLNGGGGGGGNGPNNNGIERPTSKLNIGIPKQQYLKVTKLNSKYDSYRYSMVSATRGKAVAASELRNKGFESALWKALGVTGNGSSSGGIGSSLTASEAECYEGKAVAASELRNKGFESALWKALGVTGTNGGGGGGIGSSLTASEATALITLERDFLSQGSELLEDVAMLSREITNAAVLDEMEEMGVEPGIIDAQVIVKEEEEKKDVSDAQKEFFNITANDADATTDTTTADKEKNDDKKKKAGAGLQTDIMKAVKEVEAINTQITLLELDFIQDIVEVLGPNRADTIRTTIVGNMIAGEAGTLLKTLKERPLATVLSSFSGGGGSVDAHHAGKNLYVTRFPGDVTASQLNELREEVTGILQVAKPGDEALLVLQSGGGTVTGYGLAAAQLQRFKAKNIKLTVCVEQVAASGGYMMCCTADRIVASPFAVLGSIGVISEVPNAYERLQREGIEFATITAGKYKRTVTPTKKVTKEDLKKSTEDINEIFNLFKSFVGSQRPQLDIENVATGDTWFGEDALARGLCDELATADDVLLDFVDQGYDLYEVAYAPTPVGAGAFSLPRSSSGSADKAGMNGWRGVLKSVVRGVVSDVKEEIVSEFSTSMNEMNSLERRYMMKDDSADRIKAQE